MKILAWIVLILCSLVFLFLTFLSTEDDFTEALVGFIAFVVTILGVGTLLAAMCWSINVIGSY